MSAGSLRQAGATVIIFLIVAKTVGVFKEILIAAQFGTSQTVDVFLAGITIPAILGTLFYQSLPNAFVPLFARGTGTSRSRRRTALGLLAIIGMITIGLWLFADALASLTSQGFSLGAREETVAILQIAAVSVLLATVDALFRSRLLTRKKFAYIGIGSMWPGIAMIIAVLAFPEGGSRTLVWGFVSGAGLAALWNSLPFLQHLARRTPSMPKSVPTSTQTDGGLWTVIVMVLGSAGIFYTLLDRYFASFLAEGSIAAIKYANLVASQPVALFGGALGTAVFPYLSQRAAEHNIAEIRQILNRAIRWVLVASVPFAVWCIVFGEEIISLLYERGAFDASSREMTGLLLIPYGVWLVPAVLSAVLIKLKYASFHWRAILASTALGLVIKVVGSIWLVAPLDALGLVVATAASRVGMVTVLFLFLSRELSHGYAGQWIRLGIFVAGLSVAGSTLGLALAHFLSIADWTVAAIARLSLGIVFSLGLIGVLGPFVGIDEVTRIYRWVSSRVLRR